MLYMVGLRGRYISTNTKNRLITIIIIYYNNNIYIYVLNIYGLKYFIIVLNTVK